MINSYLSNKINAFHAVGFLSIMLHHCGYRDLLPATNIFIGCVSNYSIWAISMYFMLSGYLFFQGIESNNLFHKIREKYFKRCRTLVLPFAIWSFIGSIMYFVLYKIGFRDEWTQMAHDFSQGNFVTLFLHPGVLQMWFVKDLIYCLILAIPIWFFAKVFHFSLIFFLLIFSFFFDNFFIGPINLSSSSLLYFSIGSWISISKCNIDTRSIPSVIGVILGCLSYLFFVLQSFPTFHNNYLILIFNILFFISLWLIYDHFPSFFIFLDSHFSLRQTQFFMFATFEPFYFISKSLMIQFCGQYFKESSIIQILVLSGAYVLVFIVINRIAIVVRSFVPATFSILTGGRS